VIHLTCLGPEAAQHSPHFRYKSKSPIRERSIFWYCRRTTIGIDARIANISLTFYLFKPDSAKVLIEFPNATRRVPSSSPLYRKRVVQAEASGEVFPRKLLLSRCIFNGDSKSTASRPKVSEAIRGFLRNYISAWNSRSSEFLLPPLPPRTDGVTAPWNVPYFSDPIHLDIFHRYILSV